MKKSLFLLRGLPGSGKSTIAELLSEEGKYPAYSIDDYFTDEQTGEYKFRFDENHLAYWQCQQNVELAMQSENKKIFVHNTFTMVWEMEPYFKMARVYNYSVYVLTVENRHGSKNNHAIPEDHIKKMAEKYKVVLM
jgi:predicted kinase